VNILATLQDGFNAIGLDVRKYPTKALNSRMRMLGNHGIDMVFDVGANQGQYATELRKLGYRHSIVSFEPLSAAFATLDSKAADVDNWSAVNSAIGNVDGKIPINVSSNSVSSSILEISDEHVKAVPSSSVVGSEEVSIHKLSSIVDQWCPADKKLFVKVDTQGYEKSVVEGAHDCMHRISGFQLELSLTTLYAGEALFGDFIVMLKDYGFSLKGIEPGFYSPDNSELLQADAIFYKDR